MYDTIHDFLLDYGLWTILVMLVLKFATGVVVAIDKSEFKWYYLGNVFKTDFLKIATFALLLGVSKYAGVQVFDNDVVKTGMGAVLLTDLTAGVVKNIAHLFPTVANAVPSSMREPSRLRLGNPKNIPIV